MQTRARTRPIHCPFESLRAGMAAGTLRRPGFATHEQLTALGHARITRFPFAALPDAGRR